MNSLNITNILPRKSILYFFFNNTATTEIYTLSLHDALPISACPGWRCPTAAMWRSRPAWPEPPAPRPPPRSEEHTSELQSQFHLVCRLLLEKKKDKGYIVEART